MDVVPSDATGEALREDTLRAEGPQGEIYRDERGVSDMPIEAGLLRAALRGGQTGIARYFVKAFKRAPEYIVPLFDALNDALNDAEQERFGDFVPEHLRKSLPFGHRKRGAFLRGDLCHCAGRISHTQKSYFTLTLPLAPLRCPA